MMIRRKLIGLEKYHKIRFSRASSRKHSNNKRNSIANSNMLLERISKLKEMDQISISKTNKLRMLLVSL